MTELDFKLASLPPETIRFLSDTMPAIQDGEANGVEKDAAGKRCYDCEFCSYTASS